jgi:AGZA family xanthine/uracil permease-like MFS transporter
MTWTDKINQRVATSAVGRWFKLEGCGHVSASRRVQHCKSKTGAKQLSQQPKERKGSYFLTEMRAGLATFFAMA